MRLDQKVAVVTGTGSGIGKAAALLFAREGASIGVLSHNPEEVQQVVSEIESAGGKAIALVADASDSSAVQNAMNQTVERFGRLDIVFANAGINGVWAPIEELADEEFDHTIKTNLRSTFITIKYAVPHLKKTGSGSVIVTASVNGTRIFSNTGATAYSVTKAGQVAMAKMLALELAPSSIRVNIICPGAIDTNIKENTEQRDVEKVKLKVEFERKTPLTNHPGKAEDVADLALFLASDASRHITGSPIWIDGAESLIKG